MEKQGETGRKDGSCTRKKICLGKAARPPFYGVALFLYKKACIRRLPLFASRQVETDLAQLHPGENIQWVKMEFYVRKLALSLLVLTVGILFGVAAKVSAGSKALLEEGGILHRGAYEEGEKEVVLEARIQEECQEFRICLAPREFSREELEELAVQLLEEIPGQILGDNQDLGQVYGDLLLEDAYGGYPFEVEWESSRPDVIGSSGVVGVQKEPIQVALKARLLYQGYLWERTLDVTVAPPALSPQEAEHHRLQEFLLAEEQNGRQREDWTLPGEWNGRQIQWRQKVEDGSSLLWAAALAVAVLVYGMADRDLHGRLERRRKALKREYPDIVHQLMLYIGAGMTIRGAFQRMAEEYEKKGGGKLRIQKGMAAMPGHEEMVYTCRELFSGISEGAAYEHFGRRTGLQEYIRLSTLLMQNLKRGNGTLLERLQEETQKANEERLQQGRKLGEEAGTKLLIPMVLMLAIVMIVLVIPAFATI